MNSHSTQHPFGPGGPNYDALWKANLAWGIIAFAILLFALALWAFMASGWYQPNVEAPIQVPAVEEPSPTAAGAVAH